MLRSLKSLTFLASLVCVLVGPATARYVYVFPAPGAGGTVQIYTADPFVQVATVATLPDPIFAFTNIEGTRAYVLARSGNVAVLNASQQFAPIGAPYSIGSPITSAILSTDRRKILVTAAGALRVIPLYNSDGTPLDSPQSIPNIAADKQLDDVAVSIDSSTAIATSSVTRSIVAIDLITNAITAQQTISQAPSGVGVAPNGLVYVAATGRLYEIDLQNGLTFVNPGGFQFDGNAGKPAFTPDGKVAVMLNRTAGAATGIIVVDLRNRTVSTAFQGLGVQLDRPVVVNNSTGYAVSGGRLYSFALTPAGVPVVSPLAIAEGAAGVVSSDETDQARALYILYANSIFRASLVAGSGIGPLTFSSPAAGLAYSGGGSVGQLAVLRNTTLDVQMAVSGQSLPLVVRAVDTNGKPIPDLSIAFSTNATGFSFAQPIARTNADGLAAVRGTLPAAPGNYVVRASAPNGISVEFTVRVAASSGTGSTQFAVTAGSGQIITSGGLSQPFQVQLRDAQGNPIAGATVNWLVKAGPGVIPIPPSSTTDSNGFALTQVSAPQFSPQQTQQFLPVTLSAAVSIPSFEDSVDMFGVVYPNSNPLPTVLLSAAISPTNGEFLLPAGGVVPGAFVASALTNITSPPGLTPVRMPNVGIRANATSGDITVSCRDNPVSSADGIATCDLVAGTRLGSGTMLITVGESSAFTYTYPIRIIPGNPARMIVLAGDGQSGAPGTVTPRSLVVQIQDASGTILPGVKVTWTLVSGAAELVGVVDTTDREGRSGTQVRFGSTPGDIIVRAETGGLSATFTLHNSVAIGAFTIQSGNNQAAAPGSQFLQPLVVKMTSAQGAPIVGATVAFAVTSGPVTLSGANITTDVQGLASVTAQAGSTTGPATVTASVGSSVLTFNLNVASGPTISAVVNGAGFQPGLAPCSVATIRGIGFTQTTGIISGPTTGPLPLTLAGVGVQVASTQVPIYAVANVSGQQQINIQIPCEIGAGDKQVIVTAQGAASPAFSVTLSDVRPGIFTSTNSQNRDQAILVHANGTYVSPENPAIWGETLTGFFTGLGVNTLGIQTNVPGLGQVIPQLQVIIGVNDQGVTVRETTYAPNLIGVYLVRFTVDPVGSGDALNFAIAVFNSQNQPVYGNPTTIPVRQQ